MKTANPAQRRRNFRIQAPQGTLLECLLENKCFTMHVIDISLGGILCARVRIGKTGQEPPFCSGQELERIQLSFPDHRDVIAIAGACIIREDDESDPACYRYGIEFTRIADRSRQRLLEMIYYHQRQFLRQRLDINL